VPQAIAFGIIAGYADAVGYLRFKAFAGMMTGNTVLMGLAVFGRADLPVWAYGAVLALFFAAAVTAYVLAPRLTPPGILIAEALLIVLADAIDAPWAVAFLVLAMGLQNPVASRLGVPLNTTFITGAILRFGEGLARYLAPHASHVGDARFMIFGLVWLGYFAGAALGTGAFELLRWPSIVPLLLLAFIYWQSRRQA
jgi:uncharacterized membrane protein YoaK (UPF0700 family)